MLADGAWQHFKFQCRNVGKAATAKPWRFKFWRARGGAGALAGLHLAPPVRVRPSALAEHFFGARLPWV
jgi:hypothetical protein